MVRQNNIPVTLTLLLLGLSLSSVAFVPDVSAQSLQAPGIFCYNDFGGVACFERDKKGKTQKAPKPKSTGGSFSQEDSISRNPRRFGPCSAELKKKVCEEVANGCKNQASIRPAGAPGTKSFPTKAEQMLSQAKGVVTDLGAPAGTTVNYNFSYNMTCEMKDVGGEPPVCEFSTYCLVRGDFSY